MKRWFGCGFRALAFDWEAAGDVRPEAAPGVELATGGCPFRRHAPCVCQPVREVTTTEPAASRGLAFRRSDSQDLPAITRLLRRFDAAVGEDSPGARQLTRASDPSAQTAVVVDGLGDVIGVMSGSSQLMRWHGERAHAVARLPMILDPQLGGQMRKAIGAELMEYWSNQFCGVGKNLLSWEPVGDALATLEVLSCRDGTRLTMRRPRLSIARRGRIPADIDDAWRICEPEMEFGLVRDGNYLTARYGGTAGQRYTWFTARNPITGGLRGAAVIRVGGLDPTGITILDWLVPGEDREAREALLHGIVRFARRRRSSSLVISLPRWSAHFRWLEQIGFEAQNSDFAVGGSAHDGVTDLARVRGRWYASLGDVTS